MRVGLLALLGLAACAGPTSDPLPLGRDAASCGSCHEAHYDAWRGSPHAGSAASPVLAAMLPDVEAAWGPLARQACESCHAPGHGEDEGIGCLSCHAATGNHAERDGDLAVDPARPLAGPLADAEPTIAHRSRPGAFLASPSLCGTCHELTGPGLVDEPTLTEFRASPQAAAGETCASCHLPAEAPRRLSNDATRERPATSHRFVGFDPPWGAAPDEAAASAERTRTLLAQALTLTVERDEDGVTVAVTNTGAGHRVPTGATFLREIWVDVVVDGALAARVIALGDQPMAGDQPVPLLTQADRVEIGSLAPGERREVRFATEGPVEATLRGRAVRPEVLAAIGRPDLEAEVPVHAIATAAAR